MNYPAPPVYVDPSATPPPRPGAPRPSAMGAIVWLAALGGLGYLVYRSTRGEGADEAEMRRLEAECARLDRQIVEHVPGERAVHDERSIAVVVVTPPGLPAPSPPPFWPYAHAGRPGSP